MLYFIRFFIFLILLTPYSVFRLIGGKNINKWVISILTIIAIIISVTPFETKYLSFDTVDEAFKYSILGEDILKTLDNDNGTFVIYGHNCDIEGFTFITKKDDKYQVLYPNVTITETKYHSKEYELYLENYNDNNMALLVTDGLAEPTHGYPITDNKNGNYTYYYCKYKGQIRYKEGYYSLIDDTNNYQVNLNNNNMTLEEE